MLHMRHPYEMGGAYWLFTLFYTQISTFVVLSMGTPTKGAVIQQDDLWALAVLLAIFWVSAIVGLFMCCEKGFKHTFYQPTRGWEYNRALFDTRDDEYRMSIFDDHSAYYMWYRGEITEWLFDVWVELYQMKPVWFTDDVRSERAVRTPAGATARPI